jgi:hypothetical protein
LEQNDLVAINTKGLEEKIDSLFLNKITENNNCRTVEPFIHTKKVIIPDGTLYNISFEMLTDKLLDSYKGLSLASLLSRYLLSYHYSLFMLGHYMIPGMKIM